MKKILLHVSINIRKALIDILKERLRQFNKEYGENVVIETASNDETENWLVSSLEQNFVPQIAIAHATDFASVSKDVLKKHFMSRPGYLPLSHELKSINLEDPEGMLHPFALIAFVVVANNAKLTSSDLTSFSWQNIMSAKWRHQVVFPGASTPITRVVSAVLHKLYPIKFRELFPTINYLDSPAEVLKAIVEGLYPLGIANLGFSKMVPASITSVVPKEGAIISPLVTAFSKDIDSNLLEFTRVLYGTEIQEIFAQQGFVPAISEVKMPLDSKGQAMKLLWDGWESYFSLLRNDQGL